MYQSVRIPICGPSSTGRYLCFDLVSGYMGFVLGGNDRNPTVTEAYRLVHLGFLSLSRCTDRYDTPRISIITKASDGIKLFSNLQDLADTILDEDGSEHDQNGRWPFHHFVEQLVHDIFDPSNCPSSS
ncbi:hypothetical protein B296_00021135 [Ensete ventricosum]|uniref:Uncharacterized protein n=1 Tax=Ensete ventricosum TaxID=4639 RepID=A0A427ADM0_ENSVE|nr:hypothetical protein B296_00021135 [Ensete ventricosum]